ncbi:MAG TPA: sigma 54-interacting transcriptional regulator [Syntrophomonadaceae bacterium]|nr:sigma 54-interacting transcriptional regulator [Syntrophomonadaceae bacterium]
MPDLRITDLRVGEAMTQDFGVVDQDTLVDKVMDAMLKNRWEESVVVDRQGEFLGLITKEQLVRFISRGMPQNLPIKEVCSQRVITTIADEDLVNARDVMRRNKVGRLPVINGAGKVIGLLTARDVCNGFSSKLEMLGEHMYSVMENISEAIQVIDCDGIVNFWNFGAEKLFGIRAADIMGRNLADFMPGDLPLQVISTLESYYNRMMELKDGRYVIRNAVPVVFSNGDIIGSVCTSMDVSHTVNLINKLEKAKVRVRNLERIIETQESGKDGLFYTVNPETLRVLQQARRVAATDATVLIQGESGTGKELMANVLYHNSKRSQKPFVEINCSAIPETLFESEMFGYEAGSFTGASKTGKPGKFELARGGTLFLDEVGELPLDMQAKLLRVLQEKTFYRVGGTSPIQSDVRIIAATNRNMNQMIEEKRFRKDLFYRLSVVGLEIPPLRERKDDIPGLTQLFIKKLGQEYGRTVQGMQPEVMDLLRSCSWPGNVRQLRNLLESIIILMEGNEITCDSLVEAGVMDLLLDRDRTAQLEVPQVSPEARQGDRKLDELMGSTEREVILEALKSCQYNKAQAAQLLGIPRSTLYYKMKALGIVPRQDITYT